MNDDPTADENRTDEDLRHALRGLVAGPHNPAVLGRARQIITVLLERDPSTEGLPWGELLDYDHGVLVEVLTYHQPTITSHCLCGWAELGRSHPEHVVSVYEQTMAARRG